MVTIPLISHMYHCKSSNQTSTRIAWAKGPIGTRVPGTWVPVGPNRSPCRSPPHTHLRRLRRADTGARPAPISALAIFLQPLLQLQNRRLPTFCLLQVVQRHPLTIEALHPVGVGLEFEPAVLDAFVALASSSESGGGLLRSTSDRGMTDNLCPQHTSLASKGNDRVAAACWRAVVARSRGSEIKRHEHERQTSIKGTKESADVLVG